MSSAPSPVSWATAWLSYWSNALFFAGVEFTALSMPAFVPALFAQNAYPDAVPLAGLGAIAVGTLALALFRSRRIDVGVWPRRGEFSTLPFRVTYFAVLFSLATLGVAVLAVTAFGRVGSFFFSAFAGGVVEAAGLAAFPRTYRLLYGTPTTNPAERF